LAGGIIILTGAMLSWVWFTSFIPWTGWMGGMMGGPAFAGMMTGVSIVGIVSGVMVTLGGIMMSMKPHESRMWGVLVLAFSLVSLFGMGGFLIGAILGIIGGAMALSKK